MKLCGEQQLNGMIEQLSEMVEQLNGMVGQLNGIVEQLNGTACADLHWKKSRCACRGSFLLLKYLEF